MTLAQFFVELRCPDLNEMIGAAHSVYRAPFTDHIRGTAYGSTKKKYQQHVGLLIRGYYRKLGIVVPHIPAATRVQIAFDWYEADRRRDPDNVSAGGRKIILDAAQAIGLLAHDGWRLYPEGEVAILEAFHVAKPPNQKIGVLVTISEARPRMDHG